ncbi:Alkanal monooxygenase alpha chain [Rhodobacteraceae bacterium THAF1]|uniref:LLM class flavin-dependent oxidoreductase n=1 Tax=Palleronia sp. THAF1 TaxID=2587842 RepID=UPI000F401ADC|nr:LLM class flavin-dependent oxidoreductase [Palleronia sp. THAF1]QFU07955.1 Alkanal monooxygenase alpha chain [Palleronia sp. THAF1]VDC27806.1 Alkanal monooxygenase alpha chain [Rhodobacteraceae bacterium THAF1]
MRYSILDLSNVPEGRTAADAIANSVDLARHAEQWGYHRYWLAEHHNMEGIASAATAILIGHIAGATRSIRVGAGGIMLGNHMPLAVAEQFGTLATMYPNRIDLGLGRAPGGDMNVMRAMYRPGRDDFPTDVAQLQALLGPTRPGAPLRAIPGEATEVPLWILGSSLYGAQFAAQQGLPYAFASHFAPDALEDAFAVYRDRFQPSKQQATPHAMLAINVFAADTEQEARRLRSSMQQAFANLRSGNPGKLPAPVDDIEAVLGTQMTRAIDQALRVTACGTRDQVRDQIAALIEAHNPDEIILTGGIHDHTARLRSFELAADAVQSLTALAA